MSRENILGKYKYSHNNLNYSFIIELFFSFLFILKNKIIELLFNEYI